MPVELGVLDAEPERRGTQAGELLGLDLAADPPVRIVALAEAGDGLAGAGKIIELAPADRLLDRVLDDRRPLGRRESPCRRRGRVGGLLFVRRQALLALPLLEAVALGGFAWPLGHDPVT